jgi:hypothetical protein
MFLETEHILTNPSIGTIIPHSLDHFAYNFSFFRVVLHHLYSRGPSHLRLPHVINGLKVSAVCDCLGFLLTIQYVQWLQTHTELEALQLISASVDDYVRAVNVGLPAFLLIDSTGARREGILACLPCHECFAQARSRRFVALNRFLNHPN